MNQTKLIDQINLNHLRIFEQVYRFRSMTRAAEILHMTQPGISQQIKLFEDQLGITFFVREKKSLIPTEAAHTLYEKCALGLSVLEQTLWALSKNKTTLQGTVRMGLPDEFGHHVVLPIVQKFLLDHSEVSVFVDFCNGEDSATKTLAGDLDFAIIDGKEQDQLLNHEKCFSEKHLLCGSKDYLAKIGKFENSETFYRKLDFVVYSPWRPALNKWLEFHLGHSLNAIHNRVVCPTPTGVLSFIEKGLGVGIIPDHLYDSKKHKSVVILPGSGEELLTPVHMINFPQRSHSKAAFVMKDFLLSELVKLSGQKLGK